MVDQKDKSLHISVNYKTVVAVLLATIVAMLFIWKPWNNTSTARKITVTGQATIKAVPDEYVLSPYFEFTNADRTVATDQLTKQSTTITAKLKEVGVKDEQIKSNTSGYDRFYGYLSPTDSSANTLQLQYTITVNDKDIAQKVQDFLLSLKPKGQISPQAQFSEGKKKELEDQARIKAIDDAKAKAQKSASQLSAKVGKVIAISEGNSYGGPITYGAAEMSVKSSDASVPVQVGQNDFAYSVSVEYELK